MKKTSIAILAFSLMLPMLLAGSAQAATFTFVPLSPLANRNVFYGGSVLDVKFKLLDAQGNVVTDASATIWVDGAPGVSRGQFNTGNTFAIQGQNYIFKLDTSPLSAGPGSPLHDIKIIVTVDGTTLTEDFFVALH